jgi:arylsulfatase A-like enzyme
LPSGKIKEARPRVLYCQGVNRRSAALHHGDWKLIRKGTGAKATFERYGLARDPNEKRDLARRKPERVATMRALLLIEIGRDDDAVPK